MRRRKVLALCGAACPWPFGTRAQQPAVPVIGFLSGAAPGPFAHLAAAFRQGLSESGFDEGRNVAIEYRWAEGDRDRLPELAKELVRRQVAVLVATGGDLSAIAAKAATSTIPVVFSAGGDPVASGLVESLSKPGGNLTGLRLFTGLLEAKRLGLLHELVPSAVAIAVLIDSNNPERAQVVAKDVEEGARRAGVRLITVSTTADSDFEAAFASLVQQRAGALVVSNSPFFNNRRDRIVAMAARHKSPPSTSSGNSPPPVG